MSPLASRLLPRSFLLSAAGALTVSGALGLLRPAVPADARPAAVTTVAAFGDATRAGFTVVADAGDGLKRPRDLGFNPMVPEQLWVVNQENDGTVMLERPGTAEQAVDARVDAVAFHFMDQVSSIAFSSDNSFGTCHESRNDGSGGKGDDFMGPTQWTADLGIYARENQGFSQAELSRLALSLRAGMCVPDRSLTVSAAGDDAPLADDETSDAEPNSDDEPTATPEPSVTTDPGEPEPTPAGTATPRVFRRGGTLGSHIDMLHQSALCMGIAHGTENGYWVTDGLHGHVVFYDFKVDHGFGGTDHSDGLARRYVEAEFSRLPNVPSHMALDAATGWLYYADTGESAVKRLDVSSGHRARALKPEGERLVEFSEMQGVTVETFVDTGLAEPSGIAIGDGLLFVGDHADGRILAYSLETGALVDTLQTPAKALMGLELAPDGRLWFVDAEGQTVSRVDPGADPPTATVTATATLTATPSPSPTPSRWWGFLPLLGR